MAEAVLFMPLLCLASQIEQIRGQDIIATAGIITLILFGGLTAIVWITGANFSWLRNVLFIAGIAAFGAILCSIIMGFSLGIWFTAAMIAFACGWILYDTSAVMNDYRVGQHVAASLATVCLGDAVVLVRRPVRDAIRQQRLIGRGKVRNSYRAALV